MSWEGWSMQSPVDPSMDNGHTCGFCSEQLLGLNWSEITLAAK